MADLKAVLKADDQGERVTLMEPLSIGENSRHRGTLTDLACDLARKSAGLRRSLPPALQLSLADLVRTVNCHYSNLIEGHDAEATAKAHFEVQKWIDDGGLNGGLAVTADGICEIHRRFCELLPEELLWVQDPATKDKFRLTPGEFRKRSIRIGSGFGVSAGAIPRFLDRFAEAYGNGGITEVILSFAAAHHRLLWIHAFPEGNGPVARLMSHAMMLDRLDTGAGWSIARGLARRMREYKTLLAQCDLPRTSTFDGRGPLSEEALAEFTRFFLTVCIEQVDYMERLVQPDRLRTRMVLWAEEESRMGELPPKAGGIVEAVFYRGELPRGEAGAAVGTGDRQARRIVSALLGKEVLVSDSPRAPLRLAFPAALATRWMPGLIPEG
jgi:Fic family protein